MDKCSDFCIECFFPPPYILHDDSWERMFWGCIISQNSSSWWGSRQQPSSPAFVAFQEHMVGHFVIQEAGLDYSWVWFIRSLLTLLHLGSGLCHNISDAPVSRPKRGESSTRTAGGQGSREGGRCWAKHGKDVLSRELAFPGNFCPSHQEHAWTASPCLSQLREMLGKKDQGKAVVKPSSWDRPKRCIWCAWFGLRRLHTAIGLLQPLPTPKYVTVWLSQDCSIRKLVYR